MDSIERALLKEFMDKIERIASALERMAETNDKILAHHNGELPIVDIELDKRDG